MELLEDQQNGQEKENGQEPHLTQSALIFTIRTITNLPAAVALCRVRLDRENPQSLQTVLVLKKLNSTKKILLR